MRILARALSWTLVMLGVLAMADVGVTLLWQEPFTALYASFQQSSLEGRLRNVESGASSLRLRRLAVLRRLHDEQQRVSLLARRLERDAPLGGPVGEIEIPHIKAKFVLVNGTGTEELEEGPGIYTQAEYHSVTFPGVPGITAIAGHRTTFLEPFRRIAELRRGDHIIVTMPYARFTYVVVRKRVVTPTDIAAAISPRRRPTLVLSACTPLFSAEKRFLVFARQSLVQPRGAAVIHPARRHHPSPFRWRRRGAGRRPALLSS